MSANMGELKPVSATVRQRMIEFLLKGPATALEVSGALGISEKEVGGHIEHLRKSAASRGYSLEVEPAGCLACDFLFSKREKYSTPGRCPLCRSERIEPPRFSLREVYS